MKITHHLSMNKGWEILLEKILPDQIIHTGNIFLIGNGYLGYRGTLLEWRKEEYVACIISDTYDEAEKEWKELCNAPNGLYTSIFVEGEEVSAFTGQVENFQQRLNLKDGLYSREMTWQGEKSKKIHFKDERFASYRDIHSINCSFSLQVEEETQITLVTGIDGEVWDLNGQHLPVLTPKREDDVLALYGRTKEEGIQLVVVEGVKISPFPDKEEIKESQRSVFRNYSFQLSPFQTILLEKTIAIYSENDTRDPLQQAFQRVRENLKRGYQNLYQEHKKEWDRIWAVSDIQIEGDELAKTALRFNLYHNIIAAPAHSDRLPLSARGLSCQAYQGSAFWDQEIFNLPMFIFTRPEVARNLLKYRYRTLPGARKKAQDLGYRGAFYAWISGKTGEELCPSYFFSDLHTGRKFRNHFNDWQIHISPDIVYALDLYYQATGDWDFMKEYGGEIAFEVARFLYSHAYFKKDKHRYELLRVIGPDEYHENVDNNAFTNYQTHHSLKIAINLYGELTRRDSKALEKIKERIGLQEEEVGEWKEMFDLLYLPSPHKETSLIEQFQGYFQLEDTTPEELEKRLLDPNEYWGWPHGIAVETQVTKQADLIHLLSLHPFHSKVMEANFSYYQKRTQHGSSLSPSVHSQVAARIHHLEKALEYFYQSVTIDLLGTNKDIVGGTFIGGIHTAACGGAWLMILKGFAGLEIQDDTLLFSPLLPCPWREISFFLLFRGQGIKMRISQREVSIQAEDGNKEALCLSVYGEKIILQPGEVSSIRYQRPKPKKAYLA